MEISLVLKLYQLILIGLIIYIVGVFSVLLVFQRRY